MISQKIKIQETDIYIKTGLLNQVQEINHVFEFKMSTPHIRIFENDRLYREFIIETIDSNPDLTGQYLHSSIRTFKNGSVMIDGIISDSVDRHCEWTDKNYEAIRLQPFYLSKSNDKNLKLIGKGLFDKGLHYSGIITPQGVRLVCFCDKCKKSFTVQHFHGGFSDSQYFYSSDSKQTLVVSYNQLDNVPTQLQEQIDKEKLADLENKLPKPTTGIGEYRFFNSFLCPNCGEKYIDYENFKDIRTKEYYGLYLINSKLQRIDNE